MDSNQQYHNLDKVDQDRLLRAWGQQPFSLHLGDKLNEAVAETRRIIEDTVPESLQQLLLREQLIGELRGLKRAFVEYNDEQQRLERLLNGRSNNDTSVDVDPFGSDAS